MTNNPTSRQKWILDLLKVEPTLSYVDMFSKYAVEFSKSERTFAKDWKAAQSQLQAWQKAINERVASREVEAEVKARERAVITKTRALEILSNIAEGKAVKVEGQIVMPSPRERISAVAQLSKMEGWDAPQEINQTGSINIIKWFENEAD